MSMQDDEDFDNAFVGFGENKEEPKTEVEVPKEVPAPEDKTPEEPKKDETPPVGPTKEEAEADTPPVDEKKEEEEVKPPVKPDYSHLPYWLRRWLGLA